MAVSFMSGVFFKLCCIIVYVTAVLQPSSAEGNEKCDIFNIECPAVTTTSLTPALTTANATAQINTTPPTTYHTTEESVTSRYITTSNVTVPRSSPLTTPSNPTSCCGCSEKCKQCIGPGEYDCFECIDDYIVDISTNSLSPDCIPCNEICFGACHDADDMCQCMNNSQVCQHCSRIDTQNVHGRCRDKNLFDILGLAGVIGIGVGAVAVIIVVVVIICCCCCRGSPPQPVKKDFRHSNIQLDPRQPLATDANSPDEHHAFVFDNQQNVDDDVYGNVDPRGNILMINQPEHEGRSTELRRPSRVAPLPPTALKSPARPPVVPPKAAQEEPSDFGAMYGNTAGPARSGLQKFHPKKTTVEEPQLPPLPQKLREPSPEKPRKLPRPTADRDESTPPPVSAKPPKSPLRQFHFVPEQEDLPTRAPPSPPSSSTSLGPDTLPPRSPPPTLPKKSASLPPSKVAGPAHQGVTVLPPIPPAKKKKPMFPKKTAGHWDDESVIREDVEIRRGSALSNDDVGGDYEVSVRQQPEQQDFGMDYEVIQIDAPAPTAPPAPPPNQQAQDWGDAYEAVEHPSEEQDYGGDYEILEITPTQKPRTDISQRKQMPLPAKPLATPTKRKPSRGEVYDDPNRPKQKGLALATQNNNANSSAEQDFGGEYRNLNSPEDAGRKPRPTARLPPPLPKKQPIAEKPESVYQQAPLSADEAPAKLFQDGEQELYENEASIRASRYRNVPEKTNDQPVTSGSYITMQRK